MKVEGSTNLAMFFIGVSGNSFFSGVFVLPIGNLTCSDTYAVSRPMSILHYDTHCKQCFSHILVNITVCFHQREGENKDASEQTKVVMVHMKKKTKKNNCSSYLVSHINMYGFFDQPRKQRNLQGVMYVFSMLILIMMVFIAPLTYSKLNLKVVGGNCN